MAFNFDEWALLAKQDRIAFEQKRAVTLQQYIASRAHTDCDLRKLHGLQFKIDILRRKHKTPIAACIAISALLMQHVEQLANLDLLIDIHKVDKQHHTARNADIIPFPGEKK
jgi:hypothetical protein